MIETELQKSFSEGEIQAFYEDLKANLKKYEEVDVATVDTLYGFIDFDQFKKAVLRHKTEVAKASAE